jgi:hypothetical protein
MKKALLALVGLGIMAGGLSLAATPFIALIVCTLGLGCIVGANA